MSYCIIQSTAHVDIPLPEIDLPDAPESSTNINVGRPEGKFCNFLVKPYFKGFIETK